MKRVYQSIVDHPTRTGDCLAACIATILELDLEDVPHFVEEHDDDWFEALGRWLNTEHGLGCVYLEAEADTALQVGPSPFIAMSTPFKPVNGAGCHAVVAVVGPNGDWRVVHDPTPDSKGIMGVCNALFFTVPALDLEATES